MVFVEWNREITPQVQVFLMSFIIIELLHQRVLTQ